MADNPDEYFLFVGSADSESATTRLRASGAVYRKKLLNSRPDNWAKIVELASSPNNRATLVALSKQSYSQLRSPAYADVGRRLLDALVDRPHIIFVHEAVYLSEEQRSAAEHEYVDRATFVDVTPRFTDEDFFGMTREDFFGEMPNELREEVNAMLRDRRLNVFPYRTNVERSLMASSFLEDHERRLLFRLYVPSGRLYAQEAESLLGLFREWLGNMGRKGVRQEGYSTSAGQVFEFFSAEGESNGSLSQDFEDFSTFLGMCVSTPNTAEGKLVASGLPPEAATRIVSRFATQARRLNLDIKQRREERILTLKHEFENTALEVYGLTDQALLDALDALLPLPNATAIMSTNSAADSSSAIINNYNQQFINQVAGPVVQSVAGTVNLGDEAQRLLALITEHGGDSIQELSTAVHELEDEGARGPERIMARSRLKRFLADLGDRGIGVGVDLLQKYIEHKIGLS